MELERILGIAHGGDRKSKSHNVTLKTQEDLAEQLKMSKMQLTRYKKLLDLIPELQSAVETGMVSATNAGNMRFFTRNLKQNASDVERVPLREDGKTRDIVTSNFSISGRQYDNMKYVTKIYFPNLTN